MDHAMKPPFKPSPVELNQRLLFPSNVFDLLNADHECYLYRLIFQQLDTSELESHYSELGQHAYHPKLIVAILIYAYSRGVFSSREIETRCHEDQSFMYIAEMNCPNFRVLSEFRKDHCSFFHDCFKQTVKLAMELKLASLGHISLDGSKFKANSSKHKAMSYKRLQEKQQELTAEIDALIETASRCDKEEDLAYKAQTGYEIPQDLKHKENRLTQIKQAKEAIEAREEALHPGTAIEDKKQISFADHDARIMGRKKWLENSHWCARCTTSKKLPEQSLGGSPSRTWKTSRKSRNIGEKRQRYRKKQRSMRNLSNYSTFLKIPHENDQFCSMWEWSSCVLRNSRTSS